MECNTLEISCPSEPDMEGIWDREETETMILEVLCRQAKPLEWIEWIMFHDDVGDYFTDKIVDIVSMPEFSKGTFVLDGKTFTIEKR